MAVAESALDAVFRNARSHRYWLDEPVSDELLTRIYDLGRMGPTSANCCPLRIVFVRSAQAKSFLEAERLVCPDRSADSPDACLCHEDDTRPAGTEKLGPRRMAIAGGKARVTITAA